MGARLRQFKLFDIASFAYFTLLSLVILFFHKNLKLDRKISYWIFLSSCGVALSAVYSRHHHALDSLAGVPVGILAIVPGMKISRRQKKI
jgi:membrane-associated phospholipid phosphatase